MWLTMIVQPRIRLSLLLWLPETGYTTNTRNVGKLQNKGIEAMVNFTPIRTKDWEWSVGLHTQRTGVR